MSDKKRSQPVCDTCNRTPPLTNQCEGCDRTNCEDCLRECEYCEELFCCRCLPEHVWDEAIAVAGKKMRQAQNWADRRFRLLLDRKKQ